MALPHHVIGKVEVLFTYLLFRSFTVMVYCCYAIPTVCNCVIIISVKKQSLFLWVAEHKAKYINLTHKQVLDDKRL